jgi:hypothetical protein
MCHQSVRRSEFHPNFPFLRTDGATDGIGLRESLNVHGPVPFAKKARLQNNARRQVRKQARPVYCVFFGWLLVSQIMAPKNGSSDNKINGPYY